MVDARIWEDSAGLGGVSAKIKAGRRRTGAGLDPDCGRRSEFANRPRIQSRSTAPLVRMDEVDDTSSMSSLGLVFSGGGARGAYEVGVISWLADHLPELLAEVRVLTGSSVGAVNAAFLASHQLTPHSVRELVDLWCTLSIDQVMTLSALSAGRMLKQRIFGLGPNERPVGLLNTSPLNRLIVDRVDWDGLVKAVKGPRLDAVAIAATDIGSGSTHVFFDYNRQRVVEPHWPEDRSMVGWETELRPEHILASTSLPLLFKPVPIGDRWYCDGGLRQNTPLAPALRLGATKLLAISVKSQQPASPRARGFPGMGHLLGKLMNSVFLDRMLWDLDRMHRINDVLLAAERQGGPELVSALQRELVGMGRRPYSFVNYVGIRPSRDIGVLAAETLAHPERLNSRLIRLMNRSLRDRTGVADTASYLLFDGFFASRLIELGYQDAGERRVELESLIAP